MNKLFLGTLALLSSNFAFAEDGLGGTTSVGDALWDSTYWVCFISYHCLFLQ